MMSANERECGEKMPLTNGISLKSMLILFAPRQSLPLLSNARLLALNGLKNWLLLPLILCQDSQAVMSGLIMSKTVFTKLLTLSLLLPLLTTEGSSSTLRDSSGLMPMRLFGT